MAEQPGLYVLLALLGLGVVAFLVWAFRVYSGKGEVKRLRDEYARLLNLPPARAYDVMERRVEELMRRQPGQSMEYYLHAMIQELKRDRR